MQKMPQRSWRINKLKRLEEYSKANHVINFPGTSPITHSSKEFTNTSPLNFVTLKAKVKVVTHTIIQFKVMTTVFFKLFDLTISRIPNARSCLESTLRSNFCKMEDIFNVSSSDNFFLFQRPILSNTFCASSHFPLALSHRGDSGDNKRRGSKKTQNTNSKMEIYPMSGEIK